MDYTVKNVGETAVLAVFGDTISPDIQKHIQTVQEYAERHPFPGFLESVGTYTGLTIYYNPWEVRRRFPGCSAGLTVQRLMEEYIRKSGELSENAPRVIHIPVCYGGAYGPDLEDVAAFHHMTEDDVIRIHTEPEYLVYMLGFCPGFPYMGGMDPRIATPRRQSPRLSIPAGSIGIAGEQTGGYPISTPGGWQLIGRTPVPMFRPWDETEPTLLQAGDHVHFYAVSEEEFQQIRRQKP
jgi:inhibitor of KinA